MISNIYKRQKPRFEANVVKVENCLQLFFLSVDHHLLFYDFLLFLIVFNYYTNKIILWNVFILLNR